VRRFCVSLIQFAVPYNTDCFSFPLSRRDALHRLSAGFGAIGLAGMMGSQANAAVKQQVTPKAKRVIFLFMNGAPSHIDTFDPKPALKKYEGQQPSGKLYRAPKTSGFMSSPLKFRSAAKAASR
jgi:hypothetical protein